MDYTRLNYEILVAISKEMLGKKRQIRDLETELHKVIKKRQRR